MSKVINILGGINLAFLLMFTQSALANCQNDIVDSTPDQDFTLHNDGTVTHNSTGLMWMRCSLGQSWDGTTCTGAADAFTWASALVEAQSKHFADFSDWRLPNKNELASLVERSCTNPNINSSVFPNTPSAMFWSSSPYADSFGGVWGVGFNGGFVSRDMITSRNRVRLVRAGQ